MSQKILKNQTAFPVDIFDCGIIVPASPGTHTINIQEALIFAASNDVITYLADGSLILNDGTVDLGLAEAVAQIQGHWPNDIKIADTDGLTIDSVLDGSTRRLAVDVKLVGGGGNSFETISTPLGTSPVAENGTDTLNLTSSDGSILVTGNAATDTVDLKIDQCKLIVSALIFG